MDQFYFEEDYLEAKYFVYIGEAKIDLTPYIESGFIDESYWEYYGITSSISATLEPVPGQIVEANGSWTTTASINSLAYKIVPLSASWTSTASISSQINKFVPGNSTLEVQVSQSATATRVIEAQAAFDAVWTSSLTATAFKNHTAILDTTTAMNVDAVANRSANVLLDYLADLNAMSVKTAVVDSAITITSIQTVQANKSISSSAQLSTTTSITANAFNVQFGSSALSSQFRLSVRAYKRYERPWTILTVDTDTQWTRIDQNIKKFGSGSLFHSSSIPLIYYATDNLNIDLINIDFWLYRTGSTNSEIFRYTGTAYGSGSLITISGNASNGINAYVNGFKNSGISQIAISTTALTLNSWNHIRIGINTGNNSIAIWTNGTRTAYLQTTDGINYITGRKNAYIKLGGNYLDEFRIYSGGSNTSLTSITVPTQPFVNDANTIFLAHYDTGYQDDISLIQSASATINGNAVLTAQANPNTKQGASTIASSTTLTALAGKQQPAQSNLSSSVSQTTVIAKTATTSSALTAATAQTSIIGAIKQFAAANYVAFTSSMDVDAQLAGIALIEVQSTLSVDAVKTTDINSQLTVSASQTTEINYTVGINSSLDSAADIDFTLYRIRQFDSTKSVTASLSVDIDAINPVSADLTSTFTQTATVYRIQEAIAAFTVTATIPEVKGHIKHNSIAGLQQAFFMQVVSYDRIRQTDSQQQIDVTLSAAAIKDTDIIVNAVVTAVETVNAVKTTDAVINNLVLFSSTFDADVTLRPLVYLETSSTLTALIGVIKELETNYNSGAATKPIYGYPSVVQTNVQSTGSWLPGLTVSIWAKRDVVTTGYETIWALPYSDKIGLIIVNNSVYLRQNFDGDEPQAVWANAAPQNTQWHHYLLQMTRQVANATEPGAITGYYQYFKLWVDGVYKGESYIFDVNNTLTPQWANGQTVALGKSSVQQLPFGSDVDSMLDGALAQIWVGKFNIDQPQLFSVTDFYNNGYVDLGSTGRGAFNQLPQPWVYNTLSDPWTSVKFNSKVFDPYTPSEKAALIPLALPTMTAYCRLIAEPQAVLVNAGALYSYSDLTARISYSIFESADLTASSTINIDADSRIGIISNQSVTTSQTTAAVKTTDITSAQVTNAAVTIRAGYAQDAYSDLTATSVLEVFFDVVLPTRAEAALAAEFTLTADPSSYTDAIVLVVSSGTLSVDVTVIPPIRVEANLIATTELTAIIGEIEQFAVLVVSSGTMTVNAVKTTGIVQDFVAEFTETTVAKKYTGIVANWTAFYSHLTAGDVINLDPALTYVVPKETREFIILPESREYTIEGETRELIILKG